ncbi:oxidoreductase [Rugosimonospora acidiphila]|uniref:Oxidoreductase n=1 Tax=Rugosimonospora acidiphila TaxID=556531 RepID=A0ABP9RS54_9ACTN
MSKVFMITGVSAGGLGRAFATAALDAGHTVVGTVRDPAQLAEFEAIAAGRAFGRVLDVTHLDRIAPVLAEVEETFGRIDVLINNAGYGVKGVFEETPLDTFRHQFEVNVFGTIAVTQAALAGMRARRAGHILFITSMGGLRAFPGLSAYHGTKYALEGIADALRMEVQPFGIHVTSVEPGSFRTDFAGRSMTRVPRRITDYDTTFDPIRQLRFDRDGYQVGDPAKAAKAILTLIEAAEPPGHLILGEDALRLVRAARQSIDDEIEAWEKVSVSTGYPDGAAVG